VAVVTGDASHTMEQAVALHTGENDEEGILAGQHITPDSRKNMKSICLLGFHFCEARHLRYILLGTFCFDPYWHIITSPLHY
jgi:hypothetical protein